MKKEEDGRKNDKGRNKIVWAFKEMETEQGAILEEERGPGRVENRLGQKGHQLSIDPSLNPAF